MRETLLRVEEALAPAAVPDGVADDSSV